MAVIFSECAGGRGERREQRVEDTGEEEGGEENGGEDEEPGLIIAIAPATAS